MISRDGGLSERTRRAGARHREKDFSPPPPLCPSLSPDFRSPLGCRDDSIAHSGTRFPATISREGGSGGGNRCRQGSTDSAGDRRQRRHDDDDYDGSDAVDATQMHPVGGTRRLVSSSTRIRDRCERRADTDSLGTRRTTIPVSSYDTGEKLKRRARHFYPDTISTRGDSSLAALRSLPSLSIGGYLPSRKDTPWHRSVPQLA